MEDVLQTLKKFTADFVESLDRWEKAGEIRRLHLPVRTFKVEHLRYDRGGTTFSGQLEHGEVTHWPEEAGFIVTKSIEEESSVYDECQKVICRTYGREENQVNHWLAMYMRHLLRLSTTGALDNKVQADQAKLFEDDLRGGECDWFVSVEVEGLWMIDPIVRLDDGVVLRQPCAADIESTVPDGTSYFNLVKSLPPPAFMEMTFRLTDAGTIHRRIEELLSCLRLFRLGSIYAKQYHTRPCSILRGSSTSRPQEQALLPIKYGFGEADIKSFSELSRRLASKLCPDTGDTRVTKSLRAAQIAEERFRDAVVRCRCFESRIAYAIMSLEALCLKSSEFLELKHRLSQRVALVMAAIGADPKTVYDDVKEAYDIRSKYVHGAVNKTQPEKTAQLSETVANYTRCCLIIGIQLYGKQDKDKFLDMIDSAAIDDAAKAEIIPIIRETIRGLPVLNKKQAAG
jgi:hypothetical protein